MHHARAAKGEDKAAEIIRLLSHEAREFVHALPSGTDDVGVPVDAHALCFLRGTLDLGQTALVNPLPSLPSFVEGKNKIVRVCVKATHLWGFNRLGRRCLVGRPAGGPKVGV